MARWLELVLVAVAGCGRLDFDALADAVIGHDEDGDGLADSVDPCPHIAGDAADEDGDGVGDACDPRPGIADRLVVFDPFTVDAPAPFDTTSGWTQEDDTLRWTGTGTQVEITQPITSARIELGFDIQAQVGSGQHQLALGPELGAEPFFFVELNENGANKTVAVVSFAADTFTTLASQMHQGVHPGVGWLRLDAVASTTAPTMSIAAAWPATDELYSASASTPGYTGASMTRFALNGLDVKLRYFLVIATE